MSRICIEPGCRTVLSTYNEGPYCFCHEPAKSRAKGTGPPGDKAIRNEVIRRRAAAGATLRELGAEYGISHERVRQIVRRVKRLPQRLRETA